MEEGGSSSRDANKSARTTAPANVDPAAEVAGGPPQPAILGVSDPRPSNSCYFNPHYCYLDAGFTAFWQHLPGLEVEAETRLLRFRAPNPFPDLAWLKVLYVRKCYEQLVGFVRQMRRADQFPLTTPIGQPPLMPPPLKLVCSEGLEAALFSCHDLKVGGKYHRRIA